MAEEGVMRSSRGELHLNAISCEKSWLTFLLLVLNLFSRLSEACEVARERGHLFREQC